ncbi:LysR family transcriptional regulator [Acidocella sp.]|uniref:LysR family transcriptional regulator n=1 Tax=Acidocella sp. TaxID=50710 RepID=UPI002635AD92|nr:LysR family transcriptional regulator [Acidocella sp.]
MTLEQLRIFVAVAERAHVTRAAEALALGQSAVSAAIGTLESRHGVALFERVGRRIALSQAGQAFLGQARTVLAEAEAAERLLGELAGAARGTLNLQASQTIAGYWLPRHLAMFRRAHPGIALHLTTGNTASVADALRRGEAELGFIEGEIEAEDLTLTPLARDALVLVVAPPHGWGNTVSLSELGQADWVLREPGSGTRSAFEAVLRASGLDPARLNVVLELPSNEAVRGAVEAGLGATVLSTSVAAPSLEAGLLRQVAAPIGERNFYLLRRHNHLPSPPARAFLAALNIGAATEKGGQRPPFPTGLARKA